MGTIITKDGTEIFYKDWGSGQPIVFHHGWPLSADDWDTQMLYFLSKGYRVIAHDRRGHGRSTQVSDGHDMDHYAADAAAVVEHLDLRNAIHIGHSTGGGEATHYVAQHGQPQGRVAKLVLIGAVPPVMVRSAANPEGLPIEVFDDLRRQLAANRSQFYVDLPSGGFGAQFGWWAQSGSLDARSGDALRHRHPEPGHPVEHRAADPGFGLLGRQSPGAQAATDDSFVAEHRGLPKRAPTVADRLLPAHAPLVPDHLDVLVALTGRGARGRARHGG